METDTPEQEIASDRLEELRENSARTACVSVRVGRHPYVRYNPEIGLFEIAEVSGVGNIEVEAVEADDLLNLFAENPVDIMPVAKATYSPPEPGTHHLWKAVDERTEEVKYVNPGAGA